MKPLLKPVASLVASEPRTMQHGPLQHNKALFDAIYEHARTIEPKVTRGAMFGSPAIFVGRKMAACVFGNEVALKIPAELANVVIASRRATHFTPHGEPKMREWVSLAASESSLDGNSDLLASALSYAKTTNT
jgi:TfoX/Sxy family transcriptional regulator of competence genes